MEPQEGRDARTGWTSEARQGGQLGALGAWSFCVEGHLLSRAVCSGGLGLGACSAQTVTRMIRTTYSVHMSLTLFPPRRALMRSVLLDNREEALSSLGCFAWAYKA